MPVPHGASDGSVSDNWGGPGWEESSQGPGAGEGRNHPTRRRLPHNKGEGREWAINPRTVLSPVEFQWGETFTFR